jgi:hypothetical protein
LVEADDVLGAFLVQLLAHGLAGHGLVLSGIAKQALALPLINAGVEADDRNAGPLRRLHRRCFGVREGERQRDSVDMLLDDIGDELRFLRRHFHRVPAVRIPFAPAWSPVRT